MNVPTVLNNEFERKLKAQEEAEIKARQEQRIKQSKKPSAEDKIGNMKEHNLYLGNNRKSESEQDKLNLGDNRKSKNVKSLN
jgi:hypothetical protein